MERKNLLIVVVFLGVVVLITSIVSAGWFDGFTGNAVWGGNWCRPNRPCPAGEGDCDRDRDCQTGLVCSRNVGKKYGQSKRMDVCENVGGSIAANLNCNDLDFDCNGKTTLADSEIISTLWRDGTVINANLVTSLGAQCQNLGKYIGTLWRAGYTEIPISEVTAIGNNVANCGTGSGGSSSSTVVIDGKTISTKKGSTSNLILTSDAGGVIVDGLFRVGSISIDGKTISTSKGSTRDLVLTSDANDVIVEDSNLLITKLSGTGNAYACIDSSGILYRSRNPCR